MSAALDYIITTADVQGTHVEAQPTYLRGSATDNKKVFDKYSDMIVVHFNGLCNYIDDNISENIDISVLRLYQSLGWEG